MSNHAIQETIKLNVPKDFGKIDNISNQDPFKPWLVNMISNFDEFDNPIYEEVGKFETFNQSLLALIMVDTYKNKKNKLEKSFLDNKIDEFFINTGREVHVPYFSDDEYDDVYESYPGHGPLIIKFKKSKPKKDKENKYIYINNSSKEIDFNTNMNQSNPLIDYSNPLINLTFKEVFERWYHDKSYEDISPHTMEGYRNSYKKCEHLADRKFVEIRFSEIENCVKMEVIHSL